MGPDDEAIWLSKWFIGHYEELREDSQIVEIFLVHARNQVAWKSDAATTTKLNTAAAKRQNRPRGHQGQ